MSNNNNNNNNVNLKLSLTNKQHPQSILAQAPQQPSLLQKSIAQHQQKSQQSRIQIQQLQQSSSIPSVNLKNSSNTQLQVNYPPRYKFPPPPVNQQKIVPIGCHTKFGSISIFIKEIITFSNRQLAFAT